MYVTEGEECPLLANTVDLMQRFWVIAVEAVSSKWVTEEADCSSYKSRAAVFILYFFTD